MLVVGIKLYLCSDFTTQAQEQEDESVITQPLKPEDNENNLRKASTAPDIDSSLDVEQSGPSETNELTNCDQHAYHAAETHGETLVLL